MRDALLTLSSVSSSLVAHDHCWLRGKLEGTTDEPLPSSPESSELPIGWPASARVWAVARCNSVDIAFTGEVALEGRFKATASALATSKDVVPSA